MNILAIETSCDETAAAVVRDGREVLSSVVFSQIEEHKQYGGVVPEIASRRHIENISKVVSLALGDAVTTVEKLDAIAVTVGPGLIGALLVGVGFAKSLAFANNLPLIPVHHIRGHVAANYITHKDLNPPFLALIVSGGHSHIVEVKDYCNYKIIGRTTDDAAGEAFDKVARTIGFPYPGGVYIDKAAKLGDPQKYKLPTPNTPNEYDFSFSGLKTAVINLAHNMEQKGEELDKNSLAASFQLKVSEILVGKFINAAKKLDYKNLVVAGGVAANSGLRDLLEQTSQKHNMQLYIPKLSLCGDNAAMIASQAFYENKSSTSNTGVNAYATLSIENPKMM